MSRREHTHLVLLEHHLRRRPDPRLLVRELEESIQKCIEWCAAQDELDDVVARHAVELERAEEKVMCCEAA